MTDSEIQSAFSDAAGADVALQNLRRKQRHRRRCPRRGRWDLRWDRREEKRCLAARRWEKLPMTDSEIRSDFLY